tara:strand:- start:659 stop:886 length:228 start_codon:yes stop_codon:yes gene_type:complete
MKLMLENWKRLLEGEVVQFPHQPKVNKEDIQLVIDIEHQIASRLVELHGNNSEVPIEKLEKLDEIMYEIEGMFKV